MFINFFHDKTQREIENLLIMRDLSEISRGGGGLGILNLGSEIRWPIPAMGVKFANPPLELGLKYHDPLSNRSEWSEWMNKRLNFLDTHINIIAWLTSYHEVKMVKLKNRPLPSSKSLTFKVRPSANSSHSFHFQEKLNLLFNKRFRDWTWAKTVTLGISKMPYIYRPIRSFPLKAVRQLATVQLLYHCLR